MSEALTESMGPMARIVIRDQVQRLNSTTDTLPVQRLWDVIEGVSQEICDEVMRNEFRLKMSVQLNRPAKD